MANKAKNLLLQMLHLYLTKDTQLELDRRRQEQTSYNTSCRRQLAQTYFLYIKKQHLFGHTT